MTINDDLQNEWMQFRELIKVSYKHCKLVKLGGQRFEGNRAVEESSLTFEKIVFTADSISFIPSLLGSISFVGIHFQVVSKNSALFIC